MAEHSTRAHALLGASGSHKWLHCTPSARLEDTFPSSTSPYAEEGTLAHEYAELLIQKHWGAERPEVLNAEIARIKSSKWYNIDFETYVRQYADYIIALMIEAKRIDPHAICMTESLVDYSAYVPEGTGTADYGEYCNRRITVADLKFGKGVEVVAKDNSQLMLYALGFYLSLKDYVIVDKIRMIIHQPRRENVSIWEIHITELVTWAENYVRERALLAWEGKGEYVTGDHCKFCRAKSACGALYNEFKVLDEMASNADHRLDAIEYVLQRGAMVKAYIDGIHGAALRDALNGMPPKGYKAVAGRGKRTFTDPKKIGEMLLDAGFKKEDIMTYKLNPLTYVERFMGRKAFNDCLGTFIKVTAGKPSLVHANDERPALTNADDFITYDEVNEDEENEY